MHAEGSRWSQRSSSIGALLSLLCSGGEGGSGSGCGGGGNATMQRAASQKLPLVVDVARADACHCGSHGCVTRLGSASSKGPL